MLIETKLMINAMNEEMDTLPVEQTNDDTNDTTGEADQASEESMDSEDDGATTIQVSRSEYEKLQREAAAAKRLREKTSKEDGSKESSKGSFDQELIARTFLAAQAGITDKEVQNEALRLASKFGMNIAEAIEDADISSRIKNLQKQKATQNAIAKGTGGAATRTKDASYYLAYYKQHLDFPEGTPTSMIAKVTQELAGGA